MKKIRGKKRDENLNVIFIHNLGKNNVKVTLKTT